MRNWITKLAVFVAAGWFFSTTVRAEEEIPWDFDSIRQSPTENAQAVDPAVKQVYDVFLKMMNQWNAHDLNGFLDEFWNSPRLIVIADGELHLGWQDLANSYRRGFSNPHDMGTFSPNRIQIRMLSDSMAVAVTRWTLSFPARKITGIDSNYIQKFPEGWKIISGHTSSVEF